MDYFSTRGATERVSSAAAILKGLASDGGLFVPASFPQLTLAEIEALVPLSYEERAVRILRLFLTDYTEEELCGCVKRAYGQTFDDVRRAPVKSVGDLEVLELWHGPTSAFKDMALQLLPQLMSTARKKTGEQDTILILVATSGDTGKAALEGFADAEGIRIMVFYPDGGVSPIQRLQMVTQAGDNVRVMAVRGNFDDAQRALKSLLASEKFKERLSAAGLSLSAANSVNFGRILFQIIYHVYAYVYLLKTGELNGEFDIVVPSGNFGNALGAYYAKKMGAKIGKIKIVSNANNILTEFFTLGRYDLRGKSLVKTISPAMDILVSSNVERLLFDKFGAVRTKELMDNLASEGFYELSSSELGALKEDFDADFCSDEECEKFIKEWAAKGVAVDPHTATCFKAAANLTRPAVITSTAHWVKFAPSMFKALKNETLKDEKSGLEALAAEFNDEVPSAIRSLFAKAAVHDEIAAKSEIEAKILAWIKR